MASGYKIHTTTQKIQNILNKLSEWGKTHGLTFNADKTVAVFFTKNKHTKPDSHVYMDGKKIEYSNSFKYLGVTIDNKLSWKDHRENVLKTAKGNLMKLTNKIATLYGPNPQISKWIYTGIIRPKIAYASLVWAHTLHTCLLYTSPSPRDLSTSRMPSSA